MLCASETGGMPGSSSATTGVGGAEAAVVDGAVLDDEVCPAWESAVGSCAESQPLSTTRAVPRTATAMHRTVISAILVHAAHCREYGQRGQPGRLRTCSSVVCSAPPAAGPPPGTNSRPSATTAPVPCTAWGSAA